MSCEQCKCGTRCPKQDGVQFDASVMESILSQLRAAGEIAPEGVDGLARVSSRTHLRGLLSEGEYRAWCKGTVLLVLAGAVELTGDEDRHELVEIFKGAL